MRRFFQSLHLHEVGVFELLVALYPIIGQYVYGVVHLNFAMLLFLDVFAFCKHPKIKWFKPLTVLVVYYFVHELIVYTFFADTPRYMVGDVVSSLIIALSIPIIASTVDCTKLKGSIQWVALLCLGGLLYHFTIMTRGGVDSIHPLTLPFFPSLEDTSRAFEEIRRPTSFFWEPSSYATFMVIPVFLCLSERNILMGCIYALSLFLSSSTNGIIFIAVLFSGFFFVSNYKVYQKVLVALSLVALGYMLFNSDLFIQGVDKMESTELSDNQRIMNGPNLVAVTPSEYLLLGADAANINDFLHLHPDIDKSKLRFLKTGSLFVSDFWRVLVKYGIIGLLLVLWMYFKAYKMNMPIRPYILVLLVALFSQSVVFGNSWGFEWIFILSFIYGYERKG